MLANGRKFNTEGTWERFTVRLKDWTFLLIHNLLETQLTSSIFFNILVFIETVQLLYFSIHPSIKNLFTSVYLDYFRSGVRYFQLDYLLKLGNLYLLYVSIAVVSVLVMIILFTSLIIAIRINYVGKKSSALLSYSLKALSFVILLLVTIFTLPFYQVLLGPLICFNDNPIVKELECFNGIHLALFLMIILVMTVFLLEISLFSILFLDMNPNSKIPFAGPQNKMALIRIIFKAALSTVFIVDHKGEYSQYTIGLLTFIYFLFLMLRYRNVLYFNKAISAFTGVCDVSLFWVTLCVLIHIIFNDGDSDIGLIYIVIITPFAAVSFILLVESRKFNNVQCNIKKLKKPEDVETYFYVVRDLIEMREVDSYRIKLEGTLKYHAKSCTRSQEECPCTLLSMDMTREDEGSQKVSNWYLLLRSILQESLEKFSKSARLHLLSAYLQHERLNNKYKALFELMETKDNKPNLQEEFAIFRYKLIIEDEMIESDIRNSDSAGINVNMMVKFQNRLITFLKVIEEAVTLHGDFWRELTEENPDIKKLLNLGSVITNIIDECKTQFEKLNELNGNHRRLLEIYGSFLCEVVNDEANGQRIYDRSQKLNKSLNRSIDENQNANFEENFETCIITISGNYKQMGNIISVNNGVNSLLGYKPNEVVGEKIEMLMPKIFSDFHPRLLLRFFNNSSERPLNIERSVYAMNKKGYIILCTLMAKILPNLEQGIQIVGFLKKVESTGDEDPHYLIYHPDDGILYGVSKNCYDDFGIRASLTYGKCYNMSELKMDMICPPLMNQKVLTELKSTNGLVVDIDTAPIQANHPLENENDESIDDQRVIEDEEREVNIQIDKLKRYRKYKIRARLHSWYALFNDTLKLNVLKFSEVKNDDTVSDNSFSEEMNKTFNEENENAEDKEVYDQYEQSLNDSESVPASEGSANDNNKQLKEAKALISEQNVPRSIKKLNKMFICFLILLLFVYIGITAILVYKNQNIKSSIDGLIITSQRHSILAETNFYCRKLNLAANDWLTADSNTTGKASLINSTSTIISEKANLLQKIEFQAFKVEGSLKDSLGRNISSDSVTIRKMLSDGETKDLQDKFDGAIFNYIADTYQLTGSTPENLKNLEPGQTASTTEQENAISAFFLIVYNGLRALRETSEEISLIIYDYYVGVLDYHIFFMIIATIVGLFLTCLGTLCLIPIVFKVLHTSKMVMALFGKIKQSNIRDLASKCDAYIITVLNEQKKNVENEAEKLKEKLENEENTGENKEKEDYSLVGDDEDDDEDEEYDNQTQKPKNSNIEELMSANEGQNPENQLIKQKNGSESSKTNSRTGSMFNSGMKKGNKKKGKKGAAQPEVIMEAQDESEEVEDNQYDLRGEKLMNSRDNSSNKVILLFLAFGILSNLPFIIIFAWEYYQIYQLKFLYKHLEVISRLPSEVKYSLLFTYENLSKKSIINIDVKDSKISGSEYYLNKSYDSIKEMGSAFESSFPSEFSSYTSYYDTLYTKDLCENFASVKENCQGGINTILSKGAQSSIYLLLTNAHQLVVEMSNSDKSDAAVKSIIQSERMRQSEEVMVNTALVFDAAINSFNTSMDAYITTMERLNVLIMVASIIFLLVIFCCCWRPYLKNLNKDIWRTKGMLSMIPMKVIKENKALENAIVNENLIQAVKQYYNQYDKTTLSSPTSNYRPRYCKQGLP